jgi:hypothetical protein
MRGCFHDPNPQIRTRHHEAAQNYCEVIQTLSWGVLTVRRALAKRLYPRAGDDEVIKQSDSLALVSDEEYALHQMSCSRCHLHGDRSYRTINPEKLNKNCRVCGILHKCYQHFADQQHFGNRQYVEDHYSHMMVSRDGSRPGIQICFLYLQDIGPRCRGAHVQLYSKGLSSIKSQEID